MTESCPLKNVQHFNSDWIRNLTMMQEIRDERPATITLGKMFSRVVSLHIPNISWNVKPNLSPMKVETLG